MDVFQTYATPAEARRIFWFRFLGSLGLLCLTAVFWCSLGCSGKADRKNVEDLPTTLRVIQSDGLRSTIVFTLADLDGNRRWVAFVDPYHKDYVAVVRGDLVNVRHNATDDPQMKVTILSVARR